MEIDKLVAVEKQDDHVMKIIIDNYERTKDFLFTAMIPEQRLVVEEFIETKYKDDGQNSTLSYTVTSQIYDAITPNNEFINNLLEAIVAPNNRNPTVTSPNTLESSTTLQNLTPVSRSPMQSNQVQEVTQLLQKFIAHCGQTFLQNQITGSHTSNIAHASGIVNSISNHIEIASSPTVITKHSSELTLSITTNGEDCESAKVLEQRDPPPYKGYLLETPTTSPDKRTPVLHVHQNVRSTQQVGVRIYENNVSASPQHQTSALQLQTSAPELQSSAAKHQTSAPELQSSAAKHQKSAPEHQTSAAKHQTSVSQLQTSAPELQTSAPEHQTSAAKHQTPASQLQTSAPELQTSAPELQKSAPELQTSVPELQKSAPELQKSAPELQTSAPELQKSAPELQKSAPELQTSAPEHRTSAAQHQKSCNSEKLPSGRMYNNAYNQVVELVLATLTTQTMKRIIVRVILVMKACSERVCAV